MEGVPRGVPLGEHGSAAIKVETKYIVIRCHCSLVANPGTNEIFTTGVDARRGKGFRARAVFRG